MPAASAVPVVANLHKRRHQHVAEQVEGTEDSRRRAISWSSPAVSYVSSAALSAPVSSDAGRTGSVTRGSNRASRHGEAVQVSVSEPGEAPDAVSLLDGVSQQPQARDIGVRVHPAALVADGGHGAMTALPRAQRVDADAGHSGNGADRVGRGSPGWLSHRTTILTATAHIADATTPHATSANASTNGHCRSVE